MSAVLALVEPEASPAWYDLRPAAPSELAAVMEAWAGTYRKSRSAGCIPNHLFNEVTFTAITQLLQRGAHVQVLVDKRAPELVLAWICFEQDKRSSQPVVHYMFVRDGFRQRGLSKVLLAAAGMQSDGKFVYTHSTPFMQYYPGGYWNPGIARRKAL